MHWLDISIFIFYLCTMLLVGIYFYSKNSNIEDYFVGGRRISVLHTGLSVAATDVGGGFSIGLGGLGFTMGLSGSWLLFTGLIGAWLSAVLVIPRVYNLSRKYNFLSFPQFLEYIFDKRVALVAGVISAIGYLGFTSSQMLAGAKLASATFKNISIDDGLIVMGAIAVLYTAIGGIKAVIYTDTIQWIVLLSGLIFIAIPFTYFKIGGIEEIKHFIEPEFISLKNISWQTLVNWMFTIIPIWFVAMTLYQRIYAAKDKKSAQKGWLIAGLFEYPVMAFTGVVLGMFAHIAVKNGIISGYSISNIDPEIGLPVLLKIILPVGAMGIVLSAYFSAIMSTADSCLMASSANILTDVLKLHKNKHGLKYSQLITFIMGALAFLIALSMKNVLELMLLSYSFMVSGMIIPVLVALFVKNPSKSGALISMFIGGTFTLILNILQIDMPFELDYNIFGIFSSLLTYSVIHSCQKIKSNLTLM